MVITKNKMFLHLKYFCQLYNKQLLAVSGVFLVLTVIFCRFGFANAGDHYKQLASWEEYQNADEKFQSSTVGKACNMVDSILETPNAVDYLKFDIGETDISMGSADNQIVVSGAGTIITDINLAIQAIAIQLIGIMFCVGLMNAILQQQNYGELLIKRLLILCIGIGCIAYSKDIVMATNYVGTALLERVQQAFTSSPASMDFVTEVKDQIVADAYVECSESENSFSGYIAGISTGLRGFNYMMQLLLPWVSTWICNVLITVSAFSRNLTLVIMVFTAPMAFCDITNGHGTGIDSAMKLVKNVFVVSLQAAIIAFAVTFCGIMQAGIITNIDSASGFFTKLALIVSISFAKAGVCLKSQSIARELVP